ncbi:MAG: tetratricopeptide repeat protein [Pseudomonadota bacterium]|nr:tetratricopeptide repeat protein [Pseudomonadota bacterium]
MTAAVLAEAFRHLRAGNAALALEVARRAARATPSSARARLPEGIALRMLGRLDESLAVLARAASLDPRDHAVAYEIGVVHQLQGNLAAALTQFEQARTLNPGFFAAHFSAGSLHYDRKDWDGAAERFRAALAVQPRQPDALGHLTHCLQLGGRFDEAERVLVHALAADPHDFHTLRTFGRFSVARGNFKRAATLFKEASRVRPDDEALPIFVAQVELLLGGWEAAWLAYGQRETRRLLERPRAAHIVPYRVPEIGALRGRDVCLVAEQGVGDILFFLRWAPLIAAAGARLHFLGPKRLHSLLERTGLFDTLHEPAGTDLPPDSLPLLVGDLPQVAARHDPLGLASLRIAPLPEKLSQWRERLERAGPRPWVGATWRAGMPPEQLAHGLFKTVPQEPFFAALARLGGTAVALQREPAAGEIDAAAQWLGQELHDFSDANDNLEDALALVALLDRHVGVSNTNMHLAAAAGATADVLVQFPPEWRWRVEGESPWFPGFRVHRQAIDGDWSHALGRLAR